MTPPLTLKMTPTPSEMAFDPYLDFQLFKLATFFLRKKKLTKKNLEKKNFAGYRRHQFCA